MAALPADTFGLEVGTPDNTRTGQAVAPDAARGRRLRSHGEGANPGADRISSSVGVPVRAPTQSHRQNEIAVCEASQDCSGSHALTQSDRSRAWGETASVSCASRPERP